MRKMTQDQQAQHDALTQAYETAQGYEARKAAWAAREEWCAANLPKRKVSGYASRAGMRQAAERNALAAASRRAAWGRR